MAESYRHWLRESLQDLLIPAFEARGFEVVPLTGEDARSRDVRAAFPFGRLRRRAAQGIQMVEIQLDKHGNAAFRLNIGVGPLNGIKNELGFVAPDDMWVHYLNSYYEAYSSPFFRRWFAARRWWFSSPAEKADYRKLVEDNLGLVIEVEELLRDGRRGRHIRAVRK